MRRIISQSNPVQKCVRTNRQGHQSSYYNGMPYVQKLSRAMENIKKDANWISGDENCNVVKKNLLDGINSISDIAEEEWIFRCSNRTHPIWNMQRKNLRKKASVFCMTSSSLIHMSFEPLQEKSLVHESEKHLLLKFQINSDWSVGSVQSQ